LLGTYVDSPLCWAINVGKNATFESVEDLRGQTFGISRFGSGSHLMAYVLASTRGWNLKEDLSFQVKGTFES
jgi:ABC-type nitrate/sulfonate/bicarbonate transport system substrate-binding protein